jgi:hypothetical protein
MAVRGVSLLATALILRAGHQVLPSGRLPGRSGNSTKQKPPQAGAFCLVEVVAIELMRYL